MRIFLPLILILIFIGLSCLDLPSYAESQGWEAMIDGIDKLKVDKNIREEFQQLCDENDTATINGRIDTGGGIYMIADAPVYKKPGGLELNKLHDKDVVVVTDETSDFDGREWVKIRFLFISTYTEKAVDVSDGWIERSFLK